LFIDEFDSMPTASQFTYANLQSLVNACYENSPRCRPGNRYSFLQLVISMNASWSEFEAAYGVHVARRIAEMCVRIDFDEEAVIVPSPEPLPAPPAHQLALDSAIAQLL
jgi:hypothetical protein